MSITQNRYTKQLHRKVCPGAALTVDRRLWVGLQAEGHRSRPCLTHDGQGGQAYDQARLPVRSQQRLLAMRATQRRGRGAPVQYWMRHVTVIS